MPSMHIVNWHTWKQTLVTWKLAPVHSLNESGPLIFITNSCILCRRWTFRSGLIATPETSLASYSGTGSLFSSVCCPTGYLLGSATSILLSGSLISFYPFLRVLVPSFPSAIHHRGLCLHGGLQPLTVRSLLDGFKTVFLERRERAKSILAILSLWNPHDSHWLEYNLTRLSDYSARRLLISFSYSVWYWYWRKWKGKESSLKSCVVTSVLEHGKCLTRYGYCYFISLEGMPQS